MNLPVNNKKLVLIILMGLAVRIFALPLPGTDDMLTNQLWGSEMLARGVTHGYFSTDVDNLTKAILSWRHLPYRQATAFRTELGILDHVPDYPPLSMYLFWITAWAAKLIQGGQLQEGGLLNACFNILPLLGGLGIAFAAWSFLCRQGVARPWLAVAAFWLSPVMLLHSPVLGYVDSIFALLGFCSLTLLYQRRYTASVLFLVLSCLTKPQGVLILPVVLVAILAEKDWRLFRRASLNLVLFSLVPFLPFILTGAGLGALRGTFQVMHAGYLSYNQNNLWWIVSWVLPAASEKSYALLTREVMMRKTEEFREVFGFDAQWIALFLLGVVLAVSLCFLWTELQKGNRRAIFWAAALQVYFFTMLALHPHENHLYSFFVYALPVLVIGRRQFVGIYAALSLIFGLNIFLFDGFGRGLAGPGQALRFGAGFDLTVLVAAINLAVFAWLVTHKRWLFELTRSPEPSLAGG